MPGFLIIALMCLVAGLLMLRRRETRAVGFAMLVLAVAFLAWFVFLLGTGDRH